MTAASKGAVCPRLRGRIRRTWCLACLADALRAVCVCGVHFGVFCAVWWRAAVTRLGSDTRCKLLQLYLIIFISSPC